MEKKQKGRAASAPAPFRHKILALVAILALILTVRLFYYTGPIFANTPEDGLFLSMFADSLNQKSLPNISMYGGLNFSNYHSGSFSDIQIMKFYGGFIYPEIFLLWLFGFSTQVAIGYVILTSVIEGLFIFLILERIAGVKTAVLGGILFALFPLDVIFSNGVHPIVPSMAMLSGAFYFLLVALDQTNKKDRPKYYALSGLFAGLSYITNPLGLSFTIFMVLYFIATTIYSQFKKKGFDPSMLLIFLGFFVGFSLTGIYYLATTGNFFLYPTFEHTSMLWETVNNGASLNNYTILNAVRVSYLSGEITAGPGFYPPLLLSVLPPPHILENVTPFTMPYLGLMFYLAAGSSLLLLLRRKRIRYSLLFIGFFLFSLLLLNFLPTNESLHNGMLHLLMIPMQTYFMTLLTLPIILISALGIGHFLWLDSDGKPATKDRRAMATTIKILALVVLMAVIAVDILVLNFDSGYYRASVSSHHSLATFVSQHPSNTILAEGTIYSETEYLLGPGYKSFQGLYNCTTPYLSNLHGAYIATGGTTNLYISPAEINNFDACVKANLTDYYAVYSTPNPLSAYWAVSDAPPLTIYYKP